MSFIINTPQHTAQMSSTSPSPSPPVPQIYLNGVRVVEALPGDEAINTLRQRDTTKQHKRPKWSHDIKECECTFRHENGSGQKLRCLYELKRREMKSRKRMERAQSRADEAIEATGILGSPSSSSFSSDNSNASYSTAPSTPASPPLSETGDKRTFSEAFPELDDDTARRRRFGDFAAPKPAVVFPVVPGIKRKFSEAFVADEEDPGRRVRRKLERELTVKYDFNVCQPRNQEVPFTDEELEYRFAVAPHSFGIPFWRASAMDLSPAEFDEECNVPVDVVKEYVGDKLRHYRLQDLQAADAKRLFVEPAHEPKRKLAPGGPHPLHHLVEELSVMCIDAPCEPFANAQMGGGLKREYLSAKWPEYFNSSGYLQEYVAHFFRKPDEFSIPFWIWLVGRDKKSPEFGPDKETLENMLLAKELGSTHRDVVGLGEDKLGEWVWLVGDTDMPEEVKAAVSSRSRDRLAGGPSSSTSTPRLSLGGSSSSLPR